MMKGAMLAIAILTLAMASVSEVRANDEVRRTPGTGGRTADTPAAMSGGAGKMMRPAMHSPEHQLMMAYHQNVVSFGRALERVARQGDTVPRDFARTAISEMRRSTQEVERYRSAAMAAMPEAKRGEMQKMIDQHLVNVKTHLSQLEEIAQRDVVRSQEVLQHLQPILRGGMAAGMMHGRGMHGKGAHGACQGCDGGCPGCADCRQRCQCQGQSGSMMPQHRQMMQQMTQKLKAQDAELIERVNRMKRAPKEKRLDQLTDVVSLIVQQRAAVTAQMETMQRQTLQGMGSSNPAGKTTAPPPLTTETAGYCADEEAAGCEDAADMDMDELNE